MRSRMGDQLTVDDMARAAMFSKFHFTRIFQRVTGISPGRFLSALRLQRAKDLLVSTGMSVADISVEVGYNSVGTFSSRFSRSVGMSPTTYRRHAGYASMIQADTERRSDRSAGGRLGCRVWLSEPDDDAVAFLGLFATRIPEGRPVRCGVLRDREQIEFDGVPSGTWYLLCQSVRTDEDHPTVDCECLDRPVSVASHGPFTVRPGSATDVDLVLTPRRVLDPPVLLALLDVRKYALAQVGPARYTHSYATADIA